MMMNLSEFFDPKFIVRILIALQRHPVRDWLLELDTMRATRPARPYWALYIVPWALQRVTSRSRWYDGECRGIRARIWKL